MESDYETKTENCGDTIILENISEEKLIRQTKYANDKVSSVGKNFFAESDKGKQLLLYSRAGDVAKVSELMQRGAPFHTDWLGTTALHFAAANNHAKVCEILLRGGILKDSRTKVKRTPLHFAAYEGHEEVVRLLLDKSCDVNARDMLKMTPLHWAIEKRHKNIVHMLLKANADVSCVSKFKKTPVCLAIESGQLDLLDELNEVQQRQKFQKSLITAVKNLKETSLAVKSINDLNINVENDKELKYNVEEEVVVTATDPEDDLLTILNAPLSNRSTPPINSEDEENSIRLINDNILDESNLELKSNEASISQLGNFSEDSRESVMELLKSHGISMLSSDDDPATNLITSALKSGRQLVLSEAGKLFLNETKLEINKSQNNDDSKTIGSKTKNLTKNIDSSQKTLKEEIITESDIKKEKEDSDRLSTVSDKSNNINDTKENKTSFLSPEKKNKSNFNAENKLIKSRHI